MSVREQHRQERFPQSVERHAQPLTIRHSQHGIDRHHSMRRLHEIGIHAELIRSGCVPVNERLKIGAHDGSDGKDHCCTR